jgi:hypothetical protein
VWFGLVMRGAVPVLTWSPSYNSHRRTQQVGAGVTLSISDPAGTLQIFALELEFRTKMYNEIKLKTKLNSVAFSPQANYNDRATAACRRSYCQLLRIDGVAWSAQRILTAVNLGFLDWNL